MANSGKLILVTGATGKQGGAALRHLRAKGFAVRALTRDASKPAAQALTGVEVVEGSLDDEASVRKAVAGMYGVYSVQTFEEGIDAEIRQGKRLADIARDAGIAHFVYSSVGAAEQGTGIPHFESKGAIEDHIRSLGIPHTILRPVFFMENWFWLLDAMRQGALVQPLSPATRLAMVALDDIGAFIAMAFESPERWLNRAFDLAGDELPVAEIAARFGAKLGREVKYVKAPWDQFESRAGHELTIMYRWFEDHGYNVDVSKARAEYPALHSFDTWLNEQSF